MSGKLRVLLVEDSENDAVLLLKELQRIGYECVSDRVHDEQSLRERLAKEWDIIICDYKLPQFSGLDALRIILGLTVTPTLIVSGTIGEDTAVEALKSGAADYLLKDRLARLGPAVQRALREATLSKMKRTADLALRESEERYRQLVESSPDGMLIFTAARLVYINPAGVDLFGGATPMELLGRSPLELFRPEDEELIQQRLEQASTGNTAVPIEVTLPVLKGGGRIVELVARGILHHGERAVQITCRDISLRRQLERELHQSQRMEAVARLAAGVAHDFNNLLTVLIGHLGLVKSVLPVRDPVYPDVVQAASVAERAFNLTHQLLALSRKQTLVALPLNLNAVIAQTQSMLMRSLRDDINLQMTLAQDLKPVRIDTAQIQHALLNLTAHAKSSMQHGGQLRIETFNAQFPAGSPEKPHDLPAGEYVCIKVSDTGVGLAADAQEQIFEPFITPSGAVSPGLALATVYGIIRQHDGHIYCKSELGKGSTFCIFLPPHTDVRPAASPLVRPNPTQKPSSPTVLVVEDEELLRDFAQLVLHRNGYTVLCAKDGEEALRICQRTEQRIDLVFTDVVMPAMNGPEFVRALPGIRPNLPVIFTSGYTEPVLLDHGLDLSDQQFLAKPYTVQGLLSKITEALGRPERA